MSIINLIAHKIINLSIIYINKTINKYLINIINNEYNYYTY